MQAPTTKALESGCASQTTNSSDDAAQTVRSEHAPPLAKPQNYGTWTVQRRYPLDQQSTFCCGEGPPRYRESIIKCLAEYKLLPKKTEKSDSV